MRRITLGTAVAGLLAVVAPAAWAQDDVRPLIEKAVAAHGGKDRIAAIKAVQTRTRGTLLVAGAESPFTADTVAQPPDQFKNTLECEIQGKKQILVQVVNGDKVGLTINGQAQALGDKVLGEMKELQYAERVNTLLPLLEDRSLELSAAGEGRVNGVAVVSVRVASRGHKDIVLRFDKASGLLLAAERRTLDPNTLREVVQEEFYGDYKDVEGLKRPMKVTVNKDGKKYMQAEVLEIRYLDKLDDKVFSQP
jgi:hypothetical protein